MYLYIHVTKPVKPIKWTQLAIPKLQTYINMHMVNLVYQSNTYDTPATTY